MTAAAASKVRFRESSGNVFADLRLEDAPELQQRADLMRHIVKVIRRRKLTQVQAAEILGVDQPKVSALVHGKLDGFSTDRLLRFLIALGQNIEIRIRPASAGAKPSVRVC
ncbi:MAG: transcriptional regulator [Gemmatimonadota bacterium]|nr:MAG: transcriptional regulator [Gemmatimonadota bacterium]